MPSFKTLALAGLPLAATAAPLAATGAAADSQGPTFYNLISKGAGELDGLALTVFQTTEDKTLVLQRQSAYDPTPAYVSGSAAALSQNEGNLFFQATDGLYGAVLPQIGLAAGTAANVGLQLGKGTNSFAFSADHAKLFVHRESAANTLLACEVTLTAPRAPPAKYYQLAIGNANVNNTFMHGCAPISLDAYPAKHVYPVPTPYPTPSPYPSTTALPNSQLPPSYSSLSILPVTSPTYPGPSTIAGGSSFLSPSYTTLPTAPNTPLPSIIAGGSSFLSPSYTTLPAAPNTPSPSIIAGGSSFLSASYTTLPAAPNTPVPTPY